MTRLSYDLDGTSSRNKQTIQKLLTEDEIKTAESKGYEIMNVLGEGATRLAFLSKFKKGEVNRVVVLKVRKSEIDPEESVTAAINCAKRDPDFNEIDITNRLNHPYIEQVLDQFKLGERNVVVTDYNPEGKEIDLETLVKIGGPIRDKKKINRIITQLAEAVDYSHSRGVAHRDIKPSNVTLSEATQNIKLRDWQNATNLRTYRNSFTVPTRGGTAYTSPRVLNNMLADTPCESSEYADMDLYALGATIYETMAGEKPFDYRMVSDPTGKRIQVNGKNFTVRLKEEGKPVDKISLKEHEEKLKKRLKKLPRTHRNLVYRLMTQSENKRFHNSEEVVSYLKREFAPNIKSKLLERIDDLKSSLKWAVGLGIAGGLGIGAGCMLVYELNSPPTGRENSPYVTEGTSRFDKRNFNFENLNSREEIEVLRSVKSAYYGLRATRPEYKGGLIEDAFNLREDKATRHNLERAIEFGYSMDGVNKRIFSALLHTTLTAPKSYIQRYKEDGQERIEGSFLPLEYYKQIMTIRVPEDEERIRENSLFNSAKLIKQCLNPDGKTSVADLYAKYFSGDETVRKAIAQSGGINYFPRYDQDGRMLDKGYGEALPDYQRDLIVNATALYLVMDKEGEINLSSIDRQNLRLQSLEQIQMKERTFKALEEARKR